ncbi:MAG: cobalt ECF transporter T component CbiQ [Leptolyngbyaceae cyanobacterium bins.59]|nr:cobalt ECF transporter T component CbiQ [Leptolyngbyaceae cyanobacterium bins.59]
MLLHVGAFHLDLDSQQSSFWHSLTPQARLLCALLSVFAIALTPNGHWWTWGVYGIALVCLILISRVTILALVRRIGIEFAFVATILLGTLFRQGGEIVWQWGWLQITTEGLTVLGSVALKMVLSLMMLNVLTLTTAVPDLLQALVALRTPPLLVAILSSMYRYLELLITEFNAMQRAALSRNLMVKRRWQRLVIGNTIGSLFIRTYTRGDRIYQAMLARGYQGVPPIATVPSPTWRDGLAITLTAIVTILGQAIHWPFYL